VLAAHLESFAKNLPNQHDGARPLNGFSQDAPKATRYAGGETAAKVATNADDGKTTVRSRGWLVVLRSSSVSSVDLDLHHSAAGLVIAFSRRDVAWPSALFGLFYGVVTWRIHEKKLNRLTSDSEEI